jgi:hypothetical protein
MTDIWSAGFAIKSRVTVLQIETTMPREQRRAGRLRISLLISATLSLMADTGYAQTRDCKMTQTFAPTANCKLTHIDFHERRALRTVAGLFDVPYVLSPLPYKPASSAQRQPGQSEAARIAPRVVAQNPDVVIAHGSTFTGSHNIRAQLGELIRTVNRSRPEVRGFVVYSSADLNAAALSIDGPEPLRDNICFIDAPVEHRFAPGSPSAEALLRHVRRFCGN